MSSNALSVSALEQVSYFECALLYGALVVTLWTCYGAL